MSKPGAKSVTVHMGRGGSRKALALALALAGAGTGFGRLRFWFLLALAFYLGSWLANPKLGEALPRRTYFVVWSRGAHVILKSFFGGLDCTHQFQLRCC